MLREKLLEHEDLFIKNSWSVMPNGDVGNESSVYKMFKYSDKANLCAVCEIFKEKDYKLVFDIKDLCGKRIIKKIGHGKEDEVFRWLIRYVFGDAEAYLHCKTNIKEIKEVYKKYKKIKA